MKKIIKKILEKIPKHSDQKLLLAFEYGVTLKDVTKDKLDSEMVKRAEKIIVKEFSEKTATQLSAQFMFLLLAAIEPKEKKSTVKKQQEGLSTG